MHCLPRRSLAALALCALAWAAYGALVHAAAELLDHEALTRALQGLDGVIFCAGHYPTRPRPWQDEIATALNLNNQRRRMAPLTSDRPMGLALMNKLARTELVRELTEFSLQFQGTRAGYYVGDENAVDDGYWHRSYLNSFSATIGGGTSQIQKNIIGEHVLGLPKGR